MRQYVAKEDGAVLVEKAVIGKNVKKKIYSIIPIQK